MKAEDWNSFQQATRNIVSPVQHFVYGDVNGNIGYILPGKYELIALFT
jgi:penicillin amidase